MGVNDFVNIGNIIKSIRIISNYSQKEIANKLDIPVTTYSNYENNHREPPKEIIDKIANIFKLDSSALIILGTLIYRAIEGKLNNLSNGNEAKEIVDNFISINNSLSEIGVDLDFALLKLLLAEFFKNNCYDEKKNKELMKAIENELIKRNLDYSEYMQNYNIED